VKDKAGQATSISLMLADSSSTWAPAPSW
jgi:hypothetical protein